MQKSRRRKGAAAKAELEVDEEREAVRARPAMGVEELSVPMPRLPGRSNQSEQERCHERCGCTTQGTPQTTKTKAKAKLASGETRGNLRRAKTEGEPTAQPTEMMTRAPQMEKASKDEERPRGRGL